MRVPNADWIPADRKGLTICDATSAAFAQNLDWAKLDATTFSWQKALGGEAAHGMLILSPRAVERLETFTPPWPLPKLFRLTQDGKLIEAIFEGETINTPSLICVEDYIDALNWGKSLGGLDALIARADANSKALSDWVERTPWVDFLAADPKVRSNTSVCLKIVDPAVADASATRARPPLPNRSRICSKRKRSPMTSAPTGMRRPAFVSGAARPSRRAISKR